MKVLFDHQAWSNQRFGGVSRSYSEIARQFDKIPNFSYDIALFHANNDYIQTNAKVAKATRMFADKKSVLSRLRTILRKSDRVKKWYTLFKEYVNTKASIRALKKGDFDVFHPTYYDPYFLPYLGEKPFVITVYDMIHELYPEYFLGKNKTSPRKKLLAEKATKIIAISENTKNDLVKILGISPEKIHVVHLATTFGDVVPKRIDIPKRYILYVGSRERYKNFETAARGAAPLLLMEKDLYLFCVGGGDWNEKEKTLLKELGVENKVIRKDADDGELSYLYRNAECFVFASKYEGFGIPILEALACHCPIILSNASCFPEIAADAAEYFDPNDPKSLTAVLRKVSGNKNVRDEMARKGDKRSLDFSWEKSAQKTLEVYRSCLNITK
jgi:glycosyltransferase involved in cell wall biosynthesis